MNSNFIDKLHRYAAILMTAFIIFHLINHLSAWGGEDSFSATMEGGRKVYRYPLAEVLLILSVITQAITGIVKLRRNGFRQEALFDRLQVYSGAYLAFFLIAHTTAIMVGRYVAGLDTGFYFAASGFELFPYYFVPYYLLAIVSFFTHIACMSRWIFMERMGKAFVDRTAWAIISASIIIASVIIFIYMEGLYHIELPDAYIPDFLMD